MELNFAWSRVSARLKHTLKTWSPVFALACILTLIVQFLFLSERMVCSAVVHFNYAGIESGQDPNGNRFDPMEMKNAQVVRQAAEAMGGSVTEEDVERIQNALQIEGSVSNAVFNRVAEKTSIFGKTGISEMTDIRESAYFPAHYTVKLRYADAGFTPDAATISLTSFVTS